MLTRRPRPFAVASVRSKNGSVFADGLECAGCFHQRVRGVASSAQRGFFAAFGAWPFGISAFELRERGAFAERCGLCQCRERSGGAAAFVAVIGKARAHQQRGKAFEANEDRAAGRAALGAVCGVESAREQAYGVFERRDVEARVRAMKRGE